jgi:ubiquinone/menaquinone biosynthesis C-methylase UbiE
MGNKIKNYWEERASLHQNSVTGTTNDVYLRELEIKTFCDTLKNLGINKNSKILDVGCGDGYTTLNIAKSFPESSFEGVDYSENMIGNAKVNLQNYKGALVNVNFKVADATNIQNYFPDETFDFILSDRCLINLESSQAQFEAIRQISKILKPGGYYLAIENFNEGQNNLNQARAKMGLSEIPVRWHNYFFDENEFVNYVTSWFSSIDFVEFSSAYYYATRVIYSAICKFQGVEPDYMNDIHKVSVELPVIGKFSPIRLVILKK